VKAAGIEISVRRNDKAVGFLISSSSGRLMPALPLGIGNASEVGPRVRIRLAPAASPVRTLLLMADGQIGIDKALIWLRDPVTLREDVCLDAAAAIEAKVGIMAKRLWERI
jgi:hypothetical protein